MDGCYIYMRSATDPAVEFYQHTRMPRSLRDRFEPESFTCIEIGKRSRLAKAYPYPVFL
jgi:hypothetical protein